MIKVFRLNEDDFAKQLRGESIDVDANIADPSEDDGLTTVRSKRRNKPRVTRDWGSYLAQYGELVDDE